jgi:4-hydroxybenzoate polyprenyltransferase
MGKTVIIVSAVVGSLGVLSALLGFIAEGANPYVSTLLLLACSALVDIMHDLVDL